MEILAISTVTRDVPIRLGLCKTSTKSSPPSSQGREMGTSGTHSKVPPISVRGLCLLQTLNPWETALGA